MATLLNILAKSTNYPSQLAAINTWFFINAHIFYFKLTNHLTFFTYIYESLKVNNIRVYNKEFSLVNVANFTLKGFGVLILLLVF